MARIIMCWELGCGYGHITRLHQIATHLKKDGHEVIFILHDISSARSFLNSDGFAWFQAPNFKSNYWNNNRTFESLYVQLLTKNGYDQKEELLSLLMGWRNLINLLKPDLLVFDFSPTANLASRDIAVPKVVLGDGYVVPPDTEPIPNPYKGEQALDDKLLNEEKSFVKFINQSIEDLKIPPIEQLSDLFKADARILLTYEELDVFHHRKNEKYWGFPTMSSGLNPEWCNNKHKKIFVYLKPCKMIYSLFANLKNRGCAAIIHLPYHTNYFSHKFSNSSFYFYDRMVNMSKILKTCDLVISNAGVGTIANALKCAAPMLLIPLWGEQELNANNVVSLGAGIRCSPENPTGLEDKLSQLLEDKSFRNNATSFAEKYSTKDEAYPLPQVSRFVKTLV